MSHYQHPGCVLRPYCGAPMPLILNDVSQRNWVPVTTAATRTLNSYGIASKTAPRTKAVTRFTGLSDRIHCKAVFGM